MYNSADSFVRPPMTFVGDGNATPEPTPPSGNEAEASLPRPGAPGSLSEGMENFGRRRGDAYLEAMVQTASPAKLRLMLIERSVEVSRHLADLWKQQPGKRGTNEYSLKLLEILSELLSGVTDNSVEVCRTVADLYVFLCQHLIEAEKTGDASMIDEIRLVLETEAETWRMVCAREGGEQQSAKQRAANILGDGGSGGLNLQG
ncbi:flagellar protein FliS [Rhodopirellula sp. JC737]|nr:flagellar protein FliS [Rhodopirellula sp. JC737]